MFVNFSNHPSDKWSDEQKRAALAYGEIRDIAFPEVSAEASAGEVARMAKFYAGKILEMHPDCVMCQGEFSLTFSVIERLQAAGIRCVCACSQRRATETQAKDGIVRKISIFEFRQFREYDQILNI